MSLTWKLILGFLFAVVLQVAQLLISAHFTRQLLSASVQVSSALSASLAVQSAVDAVRQLKQRIAADAKAPSIDPAVHRVYVDEVVAHCASLRQFAREQPEFAHRDLDKTLAEVQQHLRSSETCATGDRQGVRDSIAFLADAAHDLEQALLQAQLQVRGIATAGVEQERAVHDLPERAGITIMAGGLVLMAMFVAWFSRQLVLPIQRAWAELERRVAERTAELAATVTQLEGTIAERERVQAQKEELNRQLVDASRRAGMAELANGVLHNVGNVLNSVNVSVDLLQEHLRTSKVDGVQRVFTLLQQHRDDVGAFLAASPQGQLVTPYLGQLAAHLEQERTALLGEARDLAQCIDHMKTIVGRQQSYARVAGVTEPTRLSAIVDDVLRLHEASFAADDIRCVVECHHDEPLDLDRSRVMQILMNLVANGKRAVRDRAQGGGSLRITIDPVGGDRVCLRVVDSGVGIAPENLARIFGHGFTTKRDGHGFGLHHSANAATEMGGRLWAESDGPGCGATFCLELPLRRATPVAAQCAPASGSMAGASA